MKNEKYKDLDLALFRLNENGEPLALPWIEQEPILLEWFLNNLGEPLNSVRVFSIKIQSTLIDDFRSLYQSPFDPSTDLIGEKAMFAGWKAIEKPTSKRYSMQLSKTVWFEASFFLEKYLKIERFPLNYFVEQVARVLKPQTLSDFINDCHRAGIPLVWTPYAIRKLTAQNV